MKQFSQLKARIREYARMKGKGLKAIYEATGMSDGTLSNDSGLGEDNLMRFLHYAEDLNLRWFFTGKGDPTNGTGITFGESERLRLLEEQMVQLTQRMEQLDQELNDKALMELLTKKNAVKSKVS
jgi:hypothetical protein